MSKEFVIDMKWLDQRIEHCHKRVEAYPANLNMEKDSCYGGWSKGYWEGKLEAFEKVKDMLENKDMKNCLKLTNTF